MRERVIVIAVFVGMLTLAAVAGALVAHRYWPSSVAIKEEPAAEKRQSDGSLLLGKQIAHGKKAATVVPHGTTPVKQVDVTIRPDAPPKPSEATPAECVDAASTFVCPDVTARIVLTQERKGTLRAAAISPNGKVIGGADYVLGDLMARDDGKRWAIGPSFNPFATDPLNTVGIVVQRDVWRLRGGVDVHREEPAFIGDKPGVGARASLLWIF